MSDSIQVAIKVRPLIKREKDDNLQIQWTVVDNVIVPVDPEKKRGESGFQFDHIFDPEKTNNDVFETVVKPIVDAAVKGFNGTVFAYGQTSSGKTHTMLGTPNELGIIPMAVEHTFDTIAETCGREFLLRVSYLEIYNEKVNDLLEPSGQDLRLREDSNGLVQVLKCKEEIASSPDVIMAIMKKGDKNRRIGETDMNERSSRSHSIFRITIESRDQSSDSDGAIQVSQLNLVDLAGSERARQTNATGERFKEGTHINMSLSTLGLVIKQLSESSDSTKYINFRDSKLTRLLQASLGGNALTTIICAVTPAAFEETQCTLWFASRAKSVKNKPQLNEVMSDAALLKRYKKQLTKLNQELERLKLENRVEEVQEMESKLQEKEHKLQETDRKNQLLEERIQLLRNGIISAESAVKVDTDSKIPKYKRRRTWAGNQALNLRFSLPPRNLSPIKEVPCTNINLKSNSTENLNNMRRKSIIQTLNLSDEAFETAFTDFELELIKGAKEREEQTDTAIDCAEETVIKGKTKSENRVKFQDHVEVHHVSSGSNWSDLFTPVKRRPTSSQGNTSEELEASPGTPKAVLRERLHYITDEYNTLQEFTTLERQILSAQQEEFNSSNEKFFLQKQIDGLLERLAKYSAYQAELEEQLTLSLNCINELSMRAPDILELWGSSLFNNDKGEGDTLNELKNLQHLLRSLKNKQTDAEIALTPLEKKLTNDYNECCKELKQVQMQKEVLFKENAEMKKRFLEESNKLKNTDILVNTLRTDTDCLMEKLIQKNSELAKLKERVVELERISNEIQKSGDTNLKIPMTQTKRGLESIKLNSENDVNYNKVTETSRLNEIIQEKVVEISKYKQFEEEIKGENEFLQQSLNTVTKADKKTVECQTDLVTDISKLLLDISSKVEIDSQECQTEGIFEEAILKEINTKLKVENDNLRMHLQELGKQMNKSNTSLTRHEYLISTSVMPSVNEAIDNIVQNETLLSVDQQILSSDLIDYNSLKMEKVIQGDEICKLSAIIEEKAISIKNYEQLEAQMKNKIKELQPTLETSLKARELCQDSQIKIASDEVILKKMNDQLKTDNDRLKERLKELETVFDKSNLSLKMHDEHFLKILPKAEVKSQDSQTEPNFEENNFLEIIKELKLENNTLRQKVQELQCTLENLNKVPRMFQECQTEGIYEEIHSMESIEELKLENNSLTQKIQVLQCSLENLYKEPRMSQECQTDDISLNIHLTEIVEKLKIENTNLKNKIEGLEHNLDLYTKVEQVSQVCQTEDQAEELILKCINEKLKIENEDLKKRLEKLEFEFNDESLTIYKSLLPEKTHIIPTVAGVASNTNDSNINVKNPVALIGDNESEISSSDKSNAIEPISSELIEPVKTHEDKSLAKSFTKNMELESSSIFANTTYFDNMEVGQSFIQDCTTLLIVSDKNKDTSNVSMNIDVSLPHHELNDKSIVNTTVLCENNESVTKPENVQAVSLVNIENEPLTIEELAKVKERLEKENARLCYELQNKICETKEVQRVIKDFKQNLEELQQTVSILTNENMDMSKQLTEAREKNNQIAIDLQKEIDTLTARLSAITDERTVLKSKMLSMNEQLEKARTVSPGITNNEINSKFTEYKEKIRLLTEENNELSTSLMEKIEELEKVKESKIQMYDHECTYKEKCDLLKEKMQYIEKENIELSSDLTEQIEECDKFRETVAVLNEQLEGFKNQENANSNKNDSAFFKLENTRLTNELIELRAKLTQLSRENANLSSNLALDNRDELNESVQSRKFNVSVALQTSLSVRNANELDNVSSRNKQVKYLQEKVEHLTLLNKKLCELKLTNCNQCIYLREFNESRRQLKIEVKTLNQRLQELQKEYEQKCSDTEILRSKANEDFNTTLNLLDSTLNGTIDDGVNVTFVEERLQNLHSELEELKENHNKLSNQYKEKCNELDKLQFDNDSLTSPEKKDTKRPKSETPSCKNSARIQTLQENLDKLSSDLQEIKKVNANFSSSLNKIIAERSQSVKEIESLKLANEELKKECNTAKESALNYEENNILLEEELSVLYKRVDAANVAQKNIQTQKIEIEVQLESLLKEKSELQGSLQKAEETFKKEIDDCNARAHNYETENISLKKNLKKIQDTIHMLMQNRKNNVEDTLREEIESSKSRMITEIKGLTNLAENELAELPKKSVVDVFLFFLNAILSKETEMVKSLQEDFERSKRKLEEAKQQSIDAEKRAKSWAKTVESDLEKLQEDFTEQEHKNQRLLDEIHKMEEKLKETQHENQKLCSNIINLESDINSLHNDRDTKLKVNVDGSSVFIVDQEKERLARIKNEEWESRFKLEKQEHERQLKDLNEQLELHKSSNYDLKNTIEGLDLEINHLKNTVDIKMNDHLTSIRKFDELQLEIQQMEKIQRQLKNEILEKDKHINEITGLLKIKCDLLTKYKTKKENLTPEYEILLAQLDERQICIEKFKEEIHNLKLDNKKKADILQDRLSDEEIKSAGLNKQLAELRNKNTVLCSTIEEFKDRCAELERKNLKLQRKVRNSTSKMQVPNEMLKLQDENRSLKNHLEGSYNRIKELQESKSQVQRDLTEAHVKCGLLEQELNTTKTALDSLREKYNNTNLQNLREKYEQLLHERKCVILEVEDKKMVIANKDQKLVEYSIEYDTLKKHKEVLENEVENMKKVKILLENQISHLMSDNEEVKEKLVIHKEEHNEAYKLMINEKNKVIEELEQIKLKNKELDEEMDDMVSHVHKQENEIAELQDRLITGSFSKEDKEKLVALEEDNERLKVEVRIAEVNRTKLQNEVVRLNSEKEHLCSRMDDLNDKIVELEMRNLSRNSSKSNSPTTLKGRRRHRRSDLFNQNRNLDVDNDSKEMTDNESPSVTPTSPITPIAEECHTCSELRIRIREISLDLVSTNSKVTMLENQLQEKNFPYQLKCNELQDKLLVAKMKNSDLKLEIQNLQRALMNDSSIECQMCRHRKLSKRDQSVQVNPENKITFSDANSGTVDDHAKLAKMEKERNIMRDLCRNRARRIKELEHHIMELEGFTEQNDSIFK